MKEPNRILFLYSQVNSESAKKIVSEIYKINEYDDEQEIEKCNYIRKPIKLIIDSYGGHANSMFSIISTMLNSKTDINTHISGDACSAAIK